MNIIETLKQQLPMREDEIQLYALNIRNYELALKNADNDPDLVDYCIHLNKLIKESQIEMKKSICIRDAIKEHIEELG